MTGTVEPYPYTETLTAMWRQACYKAIRAHGVNREANSTNGGLTHASAVVASAAAIFNQMLITKETSARP